MEEYILTVVRDGETLSVPASPRESFLSALRGADLPEPDAPCGGKGTCHKCLVTVTGPVRAVETGTVRPAEGEELLACRFAPAGACTVALRARENMRVVTAGAGDIVSDSGGLGFAADIGTTTVAAFLYDLNGGRRLGAAGARNVQRSYGADVISRITCCGEGKLPALRDGIRRQLSGFAASLCAAAGRSPSEIRQAAVAGNTVMEHLFAGLDPTGIGVAPFTPASLFGDRRPAAGCLPELEAADVYLCPCVAGYVGGDITAGLLASGGLRAEGLWLYIDIGTNGEMALGNRDGYLCCATAAGPAFEGAEIACGMDGSPGAIDRVRAEEGVLRAHVIGDGPARGVCGSGLIDAVAALLEVGAVGETGRMRPPEETPGELRDRVRRGADGTLQFELRDGVYIAAQDIREVQLAKAAIRAGAETLLRERGRTAADITDLVIAGGFGSFMDKGSALRIGLLPAVPPERIRHVGNAAGAGAALALTEEGRDRLRRLTERCEYLELSASRRFMEEYVERMAFDGDE